MDTEDQTYAVVSLYRGSAGIALAQGFALAVRAFIQEARLIADIFPEEPIRFLGQDIDAGIPSLAMTVDGLVMVLLQQPGRVDGKIVRDGALVDEPLARLPGLDGEDTFTGVASWLTWAYEETDTKTAEARRNDALQSWPAVHLSRDYNELLPQIAAESAVEMGVPSPSGNRAELRRAMESIRLMQAVCATIRD